MDNYAIIENDQIVNVVVAESQEVAAEVTGCLVIKTDGEPWIGWVLHDGEWRPPMPTEGVWEWDEATRKWIDVTPEPDAAPEE